MIAVKMVFVILDFFGEGGAKKKSSPMTTCLHKSVSGTFSFAET